MESVQEYLEALKREGEEAFRASYSYPFLLYPEKHGASGFATYHTKMAGRGAGANIAGSGQEFKTYKVLVPKAGPDGTIGKKLLVGRSADRELAIDHSTVSKRHAFIIFNEEQGAYQLGDAGSTNGTFLNGQAVEAGEPIFIRDGNIVSFGDCDYMFFSPEGFVELLKRLQSEVIPPRTRGPLSGIEE